MTNKNIQIQDVAGNNLFPKTLGSIVFNNANENLGGVEAGAQVNIIETVKVDGVALTVADKAVNIELPVAAEYTIAKQETAETGFAATYYLTKDNVQVGEKINIPKDMVVSAGELKYCTVKDQPVAGLEVGDPYIDLTIANKDNTHVYIPVKDLVDVYTQGNGITITGHTIAIDDAVVVNHTEFATELAKKVDKNEAITGATKCKITYDSKGLVTAGADLVEGDIPELHLAKVTDVTATAAEVNVLDGIEASTAELNFVAGVTSAIQDQIDDKVAKNDAITAGTKCKITYDAKGLVTAGADLAEADIPELHLAKVTDVTATAAEVNELAGAEAVKADFVKLHAITATAAQINAITEVSADDLAKLADITATAAEINELHEAGAVKADFVKLHGVTATATELNYVAGVTSAVQTQLDSKLTYVELA